MRTNTVNITLIALILAPYAAAAASFPSGVQSCAQNGQYPLPASVGSYSSSPSPLGGPFVPVADYAVERNTNSIVLNTASLVYKECILRVIVDQQRQQATAAIVAEMLNKFMTGNNGSPMFPVFWTGDVEKRQFDATTRALGDSTLSTVYPDFQNLVKGLAALNYSVNTRAYNNMVACPYLKGDLSQLEKGTSQNFPLSTLLAIRDPRCDPVLLSYRVNSVIQNQRALATEEMMFRLTTSNGIYGIEQVDQNGNRITTLPGIFEQGNEQYALLSGYRQLESANDIGQIVNSLFANMANQAMQPGPAIAGGTNGSVNPSGGFFGLQQYANQVLGALGVQNSGGGNPGTGNAAQDFLTAAQAIQQLLLNTGNEVVTAAASCQVSSSDAQTAYGSQTVTTGQGSSQPISQLTGTVNQDVLTAQCSVDSTKCTGGVQSHQYTQQEATDEQSLLSSLQQQLGNLPVTMFQNIFQPGHTCDGTYPPAHQ